MDGFHRAAGSQNLIEIHGDLHDIYCVACGYRQHVDDYDAIGFPPTCPACHNIVRPDVVLFGELLPPAKVQKLFAECRRGFDAVFSVGTTSVFPYIAEPVRQAQLRGRPTIEINPGTARSPTWSMSNCRCAPAPPWTPFGRGFGSGKAKSLSS